MSFIGEERIKGLRKFRGASEGFDDLIPFGSDGRYVDMASELDLEEELIFGGNKVTSFKVETDEITQETNTFITEKYYDKTIDEINVANYTKCTVIKEIPIYDLIQGDTTDSTIGTVTENGEESQFNTAIGNFLNKKNLSITMTLYEGDYYSEEQQAILIEEAGENIEEIDRLNSIFNSCTQLHTKTIEIVYNQNNEAIITERLDYNQEGF